MRDLNTGECDLRSSFISVPSFPLKISHGSTLWLDLPSLIPRFFVYKSHAHLFVVHVKSLIESLERFLGKGTAVHFYSACIVLHLPVLWVLKETPLASCWVTFKLFGLLSTLMKPASKRYSVYEDKAHARKISC